MRQTMVLRQIIPQQIKDPLILKALETVPREKFVPRHLARIAYMDGSVFFGKGKVLLRPLTCARLLEAAPLSPAEKILYIGRGVGYVPALFGHRGSEVTFLVEEGSEASEATRILHDLALVSVHLVVGPLAKGWEIDAPYCKIILEGCVDSFPPSLLSQLREEGEILCFKKFTETLMQVIHYKKSGGALVSTGVCEACAPSFNLFQRHKTFVF